MYRIVLREAIVDLTVELGLGQSCGLNPNIMIILFYEYVYKKPCKLSLG